MQTSENPEPTPPGHGAQLRDEEPQEDVPWLESLPFGKWKPYLGGAAVGIIMRLFFSGHGPGPIPSAMFATFIFLSPFLVGAVTVYLAELEERRPWTYCVRAPLLSTSLFVLGTLTVQMEGMICAILIVPIFALAGALGGLFMGAICRFTKWPRKSLYSLAVLPLLCASIEHQQPLEERHEIITRSLVIVAPPSVVWKQIHHIDNIRAEDVSGAWLYRIGVPAPISGITHDMQSGRVRNSHWQKGVQFDEVILEEQPDRLVRWGYKFHPESFPSGALDDHVMIGGRYFDLHDTTYQLDPLAGGTQTRLNLTVRYRVSTAFN